MRVNEFDRFCAALPATTTVVQWGNAHVWKVGSKIFAIASYWGVNRKNVELPDDGSKISFKCSDFSYQMLIEQPGIIPAPYLARAKWVQLELPDALGHDDIRLYISQAHTIITAKLTKALRSELGL